MRITQRFFLILAVAVVLSLVSLWQPQSLTLSLALTALLLGGAVLDRMLIPRGVIEVLRDAPAVMTQGRQIEVRLMVRNHSPQRLRVQLRDSPPIAFEADRAPLPLFLKPRSEDACKYALRCYERGQFAFGNIFCRIAGPLGLVEQQEELGRPASILVFPDVSRQGIRDLVVTVSSPILSGRRPITGPGEGNEFESLRDHQRDDDFRSIDWKATAKRGKLIARQFQMERDQRLLILVDLGRLLSARVGPYRKLDYAVNAAVRLAQTALAKGDLVGLLLFSQEVAYYLPPHKGSDQFASIVRALVSAQPRRLEPNYRLVFNYARRRNTRRAFMICFTDILDLDSSAALVDGMRSLLPRHLPMTVTISDSDLLNLLETVPESNRGVYEYAAALETWNDYQRTIRALQSHNILTVNVPAADLTVATLNQYLEVKQAARL